MADEDANKNPRETKTRPPPLELQAASNAIPNTTIKRDGNGTAAPPETPMPGPSGAGVSVGRSNSEREKKIGHRRVTEGGDVTYKKIQTSQIMLSIQLGMRHAIGSLANKPERDVLMQDFLTVEQTYFPSSGSKVTPTHKFTDFYFKTYAPIAFRYFRYLFGIHPIDFLLSLCDTPMRELSNPGASGSIFYVTGDDKFIIKTVQLKECDFLQKLLPGYYLNLNQNPKTLLPKFFALFCYQCNGSNVRLVVMNNLLPSSVEMHQKYDLKGSTYKRKASKQELQKAYPTLKDLDFSNLHPDGIYLEPENYAAIMKTLQRDCRVLESFEIMDYSLLVGIHNLDAALKQREERRIKYVDSDDEDEVAELNANQNSTQRRVIWPDANVTPGVVPYARQESEFVDGDDDIPNDGVSARSSKGERLLLYIGIIDILQSYRFTKMLEHTFKAMFHDGDAVSVHRPDFYAERFINFMTKKVFKPKALPPAPKQVPVRRRFGARGRLSFEQSEEYEETNGGHGHTNLARQTRV